MSRQIPICALVLGTLLVISSNVMAATRTWTGTTSGTWSVAANWGGTAPVAGDDLVFPTGPTTLITTNDFGAGTGFNSITFTGSGYTLNGNAIALGSQIVMNTTGTNTVNLAISLPGARTFSFIGVTNQVIIFNGIISGTGPLTVTGVAAGGDEVDLSGANTYSGGTNLSDLFLRAGSSAAFGTGSVTVASISTTINGTNQTIPNAMSLQGCGKGSNGVVNGDHATLSGPLTLTAATCLGGGGILTASGAISGNFQLTAPQNSIDDTVILSGSSPAFTNNLRVEAGTLRVNGSFPAATADFNNGTGNATLGGSGTIGGAVTIQSTNHLAPGNSPGILNTGNLNISSGSTYDVEIAGTTAGSGYDQTNVTGTVTLGGTLNVAMGFVPANGDQFTIISNDGADAVSGTFAGLAQGATFGASGNTLSISYTGGSGNDVVLTVVSSVPTLPRGLMWTLAVALLGVGALALRRRQLV